MNPVIALLLGVAAGTLTGLIPGLHFNNVVLIILTYPFIINLGSLDAIFIFIVSMATVHTFLDAIPSTFLGAPDVDTALGVLPAHRYLIKRKGPEAVRLTLIGSLGSLIIGVGLFPIWVLVGKIVYKMILPYIGYLLIGVVIISFLTLKNKFISFLVIVASSLIGEIGMNTTNGLVSMLSGMFGVGTIVYSISQEGYKLKEQLQTQPDLKLKEKWFSIILSQLCGFLTALLPGLGAGYAACLGSMFIKEDGLFLILQGGVTTSNFVMSLATLYAFGKARNGAILGIISVGGNYAKEFVGILLMTSLAAGGIATIISLVLIRVIPGFLCKVNYKLLNFMVLLWICILNILIARDGLYLFILSSGLGIIVNSLNIRKSIMMSSIMLPVGLKLIGL